MRSPLSPLLFLALLLTATFTSRADDTRPIDPAKFKRATVVMRVQLVSTGPADKYAWSIVEIIEMYKNDSSFQFPKQFSVAHYSSEIGLPPGISTIYLERYNPARNDLWKLLDASGAVGVSHSATGLTLGKHGWK